MKSTTRTTPLRQRMIADMTARHFLPDTQQLYVNRIGEFAAHFGKSPVLSTEAGNDPLLAAQLRNPSARERHRRAHDPDSPRAPQPADDCAVHPCLDPDGPCRYEPVRVVALDHLGVSNNESARASPLLDSVCRRVNGRGEIRTRGRRRLSPARSRLPERPWLVHELRAASDHARDRGVSHSCARRPR